MKNLIILCGLILSSCVRPPDVPVCRDLLEKRSVSYDKFGIVNIVLESNPVCIKEISESRCGYCTWTVSVRSEYIGEDEKHLLEGKKWSEVRDSAIMLPIGSYAAMKEFIINSCKKTQDCDGNIDKWRTRLSGLEKQ